MSMTSMLVNEGKYSLVHIKSGECRAGYDNVKDMVDDMIQLYNAFKHIDSKGEEYRNGFYNILEEFCCVVPLKVIDEIIVELEDRLGGN